MTSTHHSPLARHIRTAKVMGALPLVALVALTCAACGGAASTVTTAPPFAGAEPRGIARGHPAAATSVSIDATAPLTQRVKAGFDPQFSVRIPAGWTSVLRDVSAFQVYTGNEEYEITFDHTYRSKESVAHAIGRLTSTTGSRRARWRAWSSAAGRAKGSSGAHRPR